MPENIKMQVIKMQTQTCHGFYHFESNTQTSFQQALKCIKQRFFFQSPIQKSKNMPHYMMYMQNRVFSSQTTFKKGKFIDVILKTPTWQPC